MLPSPIITWWRDTFYICWYNAQKDEGGSQRVLVASSRDGRAWPQPPRVLFPSVAAAGDGPPP